MWKNTFCILIFVGFSAGCALSSPITPTQSPMPRETRPTVTPAKPVPTATWMPTNSSFTEISLTHQNKQAIGERMDFQLLVTTPEDKIGVFNLQDMEIQNEQPVPTSRVGFPVVSSDGVLFAQIVLQADKKFLQLKNVRTTEENSIGLPDEAVLLKWLDSKRLAVWRGRSRDCLGLLLIYDTTITEIVYPVHPMPDLQTPECLQLPLLLSDGAKIIYPWKMFDFTTGTSMSIFSFMGNVSPNPPAYSLKEENGNVSIAYVEGDTLNYLLNVPLAEINKSDLTPEAVLLPGLGTKEYWWQQFTWIAGQMQIGIDLIDPNTDLGELIALDQQVPAKFYLIDFAAHKIFDYDLDRAVFVDGSVPQNARVGFSSPDGRYFAWTIYDRESRRPIGSKILELSSGSTLSIPEIEIWGWVVSGTE